MAFAATTLSACAPVVAHGPRVRDGMSAGMATAVHQRASGEGSGEQVLVPFVTVGDYRGDAQGGSQVTVQAMIVPEAGMRGAHPSMFQVDYYRQRPVTNPAVASGWGVQGSLFHLMTYQQVGFYHDGLGIYTTQGIGYGGGPILGFPPRVVFWTPGFGAEFDILPQVTLRLTMSTMFGVSLETGRGPDLDDPPLMFGIGLEVGGPHGAVRGD